MTKKARNWLITAGIVAFPFILFFGFLIFLDTEPLPLVQPLPNPNGYNDFVKAGRITADLAEYEYDKLNQEQLREAVKKNAAALSLVRDGLSNECRVPIQFSQVYAENHLNDLASFKKLAQAFAAEGKLAEIENHPDAAAKSYLDAIHFGNESMDGGVLIDALVGIAIEAIATSHLTNLVDKLDAKSCRETAATLETFDGQRQTWNEIMRQEHNWSRRTFTGFGYDIARLETHRSMEAAFKQSEKKFLQHVKETRQLTIDFAARAYELDKGKAPANVSNLVPDYLKAIPQDPFTNTNMVYLPN